MSTLGGGARKAVPIPATRQAVSFLRSLVAEKPDRRRSPGVAGQLAKQGIGAVSKDPSWVNYELQHFELAKQALLAAGIELKPPKAARPPRTPAVRPMNAGADLVAVRAVNSDLALPAGVCFMAMNRQDALKLRHEVVLVCESALLLQELPAYGWLQDYLRRRSTLVIYRGGSGGFRISACDELLRQSRAPVLALVAFTPPGFAMAARLPRLEAVCVPPTRLLKPAIERDGMSSLASASHALLGKELDAVDHPPFVRAWERWKEFRRSLAAECFPRAQAPARLPREAPQQRQLAAG